MICTFLRAVRCTEKLHRSSGKRLFLPQLMLNKAGLQTEPNLRWRLQEQRKMVRPKCILGVTQKNIWTQGQSPPRAEEDSGKQVSVHRSQSGETVISTSQKGHQRLRGARQRLRGSDETRAEAARQVLQLLKPQGSGLSFSFVEYVKDGLKHMRVKFYIQGPEPGKQGTVHLEVKENPESGEYEFRYIFVELEPYSRRTIIVEDNRP
ncbi:Mitochondrial import inner membrane translocase subunit Tim21 [Camelus dromedarius]|uniref:Mitochondrial import inner membrane translocase subunit Tim21 n=1 Tax=Camelus dromedarius TaxID=9838 RepID=A0A5N4CD22_CAMDR|nr:Mitochondrial import inner membrane translocase subunit Tim21 [Camelus dromedarius]